jgi:putative salt-induced outer membrane protein YdiY
MSQPLAQQTTAILAALLATLASASVASAIDEVPAGTLVQQPASKGTTNIAARAFEAAAKQQKAEEKDATTATVAAGGLASTGNSRLVAVTTSARFRLRRTSDQLSAAAAANYARTSLPGAPMTTTVENLQARVRYDRFLGDLSLFFGAQALRDRFRGLDLRVDCSPGVGYYAVNAAKEQLWFELGYDLIYDVRRDDARPILDDKGAPLLDAQGAPVLLDKTRGFNSARVFSGYTNHVNDAVTIEVGLEYLQGLTDFALRRFNGDASISSKIGHSFSMATTFSLRFDNHPLPGKEQLDVIEGVNLSYDLL